MSAPTHRLNEAAGHNQTQHQGQTERRGPVPRQAQQIGSEALGDEQRQPGKSDNRAGAETVGDITTWRAFRPIAVDIDRAVRTIRELGEDELAEGPRIAESEVSNDARVVVAERLHQRDRFPHVNQTRTGRPHSIHDFVDRALRRGVDGTSLCDLQLLHAVLSSPYNPASAIATVQINLPATAT